MIGNADLTSRLKAQKGSLILSKNMTFLAIYMRGFAINYLQKIPKFLLVKLLLVQILIQSLLERLELLQQVLVLQIFFMP